MKQSENKETPIDNSAGHSPVLLRQLGALPDILAPLLSMLKFGRCIPSSCTIEDVHIGFSADWETLVPGSGLEVYADNCHSQEDHITLDSADWVMIITLGLLIIIVFLGTLVDMAKNIFRIEKLNSCNWIKTLEGFSAYSNTIKIFSTGKSSPESLSCINGIRFLSMTWVLISHAYSQFSSGLPINNLFYLADGKGPVFGNLAFQVILNGFPSVDSFFFIGATLLAYITLKELDKTKGGNSQFWAMYYIHRYIRLTGTYALIIGTTATLLKVFAYGPFSLLVQHEIDSCKKDWWTNILYINNFQWISEIPPLCMPVSWYLANDMQFFIISPLILYPLWRSPLFGLGACFIGLLVGTVIPMVIVYLNNFPLSISFMTSQSYDYFFDFYVVPWCRFQPYISGLVFGWLLHRMRNQPKLKLNSFVIIWIWAALGAAGAYVAYGLYPYQLEFAESQNTAIVGSLATRIIYNGLHRLAWSACLGWVILACVKGAGGPINHILSWHAWIPLARLSYCIYLVHYTLIGYVTSLPSFSVSFSHPLAIYWILALLCLSIFVAFVAVIIVEAPIVTLEKILFHKILGNGKKPNVVNIGKISNGVQN